jgi:UDP-N-acetylglucosamine:LPS N-acetylglucosamine transferase
MGGSSWDPSFLRDLPDHDEYFFIISSGNASAYRQGNLLFLNVHTYMPDILAASDVVISKLGYSTLAEVYYAGIPFGYLTRPNFPESPILQNFVHAQMQGMHLSESQFYSGAFVEQLEELLSLPRIQRDHASTGADAAAHFILNLLPGIATE